MSSVYQNGVEKEKINWRKGQPDFDSIAIIGTTNIDNYSSKCLVTPIVNSTAFIMPGTDSIKIDTKNLDRFEYGRYGNPTRRDLEIALAALEGSKYGLSFGSGLAAVTAVFEGILQSGDHVVSMSTIYGGTYGILDGLKKFGISVSFSQTGECEEIKKLIQPNTKSPANPTLIIANLEKIVNEVKALNQGIIFAIDNTFLTPFFQRPMEFGIDICIYSCSKYLGGHGDVIMGAVTLNCDELYEQVFKQQQSKGATPSPFDCFLMLRSIKTLPLRMRQHEKNGLKVAKFLEKHPKVEKVIHPGLKSHPHHEIAIKQQYGYSGMIGVYIRGGLEEAAKFMATLRIVKRAASLGGDHSLVCIPSRISHVFLPKEEREKINITDNYVRISIGLESAECLIKDLDNALNNI